MIHVTAVATLFAAPTTVGSPITITQCGSNLVVEYAYFITDDLQPKVRLSKSVVVTVPLTLETR